MKISESLTTTYTISTIKSAVSAIKSAGSVKVRIQESVSSASDPVACVLEELVVKAVPSNTDGENIVGEMIEELIETMTPDPVVEEIVGNIMDELVSETVPLDKVRVSRFRI